MHARVVLLDCRGHPHSRRREFSGRWIPIIHIYTLDHGAALRDKSKIEGLNDQSQSRHRRDSARITLPN